MAKADTLKYGRIVVHVFFTDGEEKLEEFVNTAQMFYHLKKLFFEKPGDVDTVRIKLF